MIECVTLCYVHAMNDHPSLRDHGDVIAALGGRTPVAEAVSTNSSAEKPVATTTVGMWKHRRCIPPRYWPAVARLAADVGRPDISVDRLERLARAAA